MSDSEVNDLLNDILDLFKNHPGCEEKINDLLGELKKSSGYDAGSIRGIIARFRSYGIVFTADVPNQTSSAGPGVGSVPSVSLSKGDTPEITARTLMGEIIHWAGMIKPVTGGAPPMFPNSAYTNYYTDAGLAAAGNKVGLTMTVEQYRRTYADIVARDIARWGWDNADSKVAHYGAIDNACGTPNGYRPQFAKP
jgi:hypothetical protein